MRYWRGCSFYSYGISFGNRNALHAAATASLGVRSRSKSPHCKIWRGPGGDRIGTGVAQKTDDEQRQKKLFHVEEH